MVYGETLPYASMAAFFFSSRRRHTRYWRDWSSDVCSSDLTGSGAGFTFGNTGRSGLYIGRGRFRSVSRIAFATLLSRSEERRVGKECRSRWWPDHYKKKRQALCAEGARYERSVRQQARLQR